METTTNNVVEMTAENKIELRKLEAKDIAPMASIISKIGLKEIKECLNPADIKELAKGKNAEEAAAAVGLSVAMDMAGVILGHYESCQEDIFRLLASLSGKSKEEIAKLPMDSFADMIIDVVKKEEFRDFMKVVSKLFK